MMGGLIRARTCALGIAGAAAALFLGVAQAPAQTPLGDQAPLGDMVSLPPGSFSTLAERLSPSVVNISTAQTVTRPNRPMPELREDFNDLFKDFFGHGEEGPRRVQSLGSGFVISSDGFVVTNNHVIEGADEIEVNFSDGTTLPATLEGTDPKTDIALLKITDASELPFVEFGDSAAAKVGDWVLAIGNPFGLGGSVSAGIISARDRDINSGPYDSFIQTDAAINRGNSGGPLFNMQGQVIGVNTAIISPSGGSIGIGFSVPSKIVSNVVRQLQEFGETRRGWLGVKIQDVDETLAESMGLDRSGGAMVTGVVEGGPAEAAGLEIEDIILTFDGREVKKMRDLPRMVAETEADSTVTLEVFRDGEIQNVDVTIALLEEDHEEAAAEGGEGGAQSEAETSLGLTLKPLDEQMRERFGVDPGITGVMITEVDQASAAAERGVQAGDVLVEVAQEAVETPEAAVEAIERARAGGRKSVLLMLHRDGGLRFLAVEFNQ